MIKAPTDLDNVVEEESVSSRRESPRRSRGQGSTAPHAHGELSSGATAAAVMDSPASPSARAPVRARTQAPAPTSRGPESPTREDQPSPPLGGADSKSVPPPHLPPPTQVNPRPSPHEEAPSREDHFSEAPPATRHPEEPENHGISEGNPDASVQESTVTEELRVPPQPRPIAPPAPVAEESRDSEGMAASPYPSAAKPPGMSPPPAGVPDPYSPTADLPSEAPASDIRPVPETQPIRVNPRPNDVLPPPASTPASVEGDLPRLDVNLAGGEATPEHGQASPLSGQSEPTRVRLPQVGETGTSSSHDTLFDPGTREQEAAADSPQADAPMSPESPPEAPLAEAPSSQPPPSAIEEPIAGEGFREGEAPVPLENFGDDFEDVIDEEISHAAEPRDQSVEAWPPMPAPAAPGGATSEEDHMSYQLDFPEETQGTEDASTAGAGLEEEALFGDALETAADPHESPSGLPDEEPSLHEGSFGNLLNQNFDTEEEVGDFTPEMDVGREPPSVVSPDFPFESSPMAADAGVPNPSSGAEPVAAPPPGEPSIVPEEKGTSDADVLDEMFGSGKKKRRMKRSTIVILSVIAAVAVIATVSMIVVINALGGLNPTAADLARNGSAGSADYEPLEEVPESSDSAMLDDPGIDGAPAVIDPEGAQPVEANPSGQPAISAAEEEASENPSESAPPLIDPAGESSPGSTSTPSSADSPGATAPGATAPGGAGNGDSSLSFDERLDRAVGKVTDSAGADGGGPIARPTFSGSPASTSFTDAGSSLTAPDGGSTAGSLSAGRADPSRSSAARNYNPPSAFPAPDPSDSNASPLGKTHDLLDAFLRAPDWESRVPYIYQGESLRPAMEEYYRKRPFTPYDRFSLQLFQMEPDPELGGPYWVYLVSTSDRDQGYPVIIRVEDGNLKVDWEIYSEFEDRHFARFLEGSIGSPQTFRLVIERVSDYYGPDRQQFADLDDYLVYQVNPPYGDLGEFAEYAFVKKGTRAAEQLDEVVGLGDEPLAVIVTLEQKTFPHGATHEVVSEYVTEGWFRE